MTFIIFERNTWWLV